MTNIDWSNVYHRDEPQGKKFERLPKPIRWTQDFDQNLADTLEWLVRSGRSPKVRYSNETTVNHNVDSWYQYALVDGIFFHICYPQDLLMFRQRYDGLFLNLEMQKEISGSALRLKNARNQLWNAWHCIGVDGNRRQDNKDPERITDVGGENLVFEAADAASWRGWKQYWDNKCSRCSTPLPKALQAWIVLQIRLKGIQS